MAGPAVRRLIRGSLLAVLLAALAFAEDPAPRTPKRDPGLLAVAYETRGDGEDHYVIRQYEVPCLAHLSYLVGAGREAFVIDPQRDVEPYLRDAAALGLEITRVILTHTHTDFVAGHGELRVRVGAAVVTAADLEPGWTTAELGSLQVGLRPLAGGPRDGLLVLVRPMGPDGAPAFVFTGDALLVGGVGGPEDVSGGVPILDQAEQVIDAVETVKLLPETTKILPAHGGGRFGGRKLAPYTVSSLERERTVNPFFAVESRAAFLARVLALDVGAPASHARILRMNREGPQPVRWHAEPAGIAPADLPPLAEAWLVDVRSQAEYSAGHVLGAVNVPVGGAFEPWVATVVPPDVPLYLVGGDAEVHAAVRRLHRVGYEARGALVGGMDAWRAAERPVERCDLVSPQDLGRRRAAGIEPLLIDVRSPAEFRAARIADCVNVPLEAATRLGRLLQPDTRCLMICKSGYRSGIAVGLAERLGVRGVGNLAGGVEAWRAAGLPLLPAPADPATR